MENTKTIFILMGIVVGLTLAEPPIVKHQVGIRPSNVLGGSGQHASFSFVRPGLTQTSYAFNGPSSHQAFSSSIGNPHLAQKVLPSVAHALAYRNPGLGYFPSGQINTAYAPSAPIQGNSQYVPSFQEAPVTQDQGQFHRATALAYLQQQYQQQYLQQQQYNQVQNSDNQAAAEDTANYQAQLAAQYYALRQSQAPTTQFQQVPEQLQLQQQQQQQQLQQQQEQTQDLLGVAYSSAPSVAHVKATGNGYNFDF